MATEHQNKHFHKMALVIGIIGKCSNFGKSTVFVIFILLFFLTVYTFVALKAQLILPLNVFTTLGFCLKVVKIVKMSLFTVII